MHWQFRSINRGSDSLLKRLETLIGDWTPYISFACLRNHDVLFGKPVTNQIYIHSKMLIADDNTVIIGSENINDRVRVLRLSLPANTPAHLVCKGVALSG